MLILSLNARFFIDMKIYFCDKRATKRTINFYCLKLNRGNMNIEQLPVEILMEIFSYLKSYGNVSLVNKHFYNVVCMMDSQICLSLDDRFFVRNFVYLLAQGLVS